MEKQSINTVSESCKRLLIFTAALFFCAGLFSQNLRALKNLKITPVEGQSLYAKQELKFEVVLPGISASSVQIQNPPEMKNVSFKTLRKTEIYTGSADTKIELWFTFEKRGTYNLDPLTIIVNGRGTTIGFEPVVIEDNPANMSSRIVVIFSNGTTCYSDDDLQDKVIFDAVIGKKINYTIYLQYAVQLIQYSCDLPKNSIFKQTREYEITESKYREKSYSNELIPVASYEWAGLTAGKNKMPPIKLVATGYNGYRNSIIMPEFYINFISSEEKEIDNSNSLFVEAFNTNYIHSTLTDETVITDEDCKKLAALRRNEKDAFLNIFMARQDRKEFEESLGLPSGEDEFSKVGLYISVFILVILLILFCIFAKQKKSFAKIITTPFLVSAVVLIIFSLVQSSKEYAIFKNGKVLSVPEANAASSTEVTTGTRVRVLEETENWCYIEIGETGGWVERNNLCEI